MHVERDETARIERSPGTSADAANTSAPKLEGVLTMLRGSSPGSLFLLDAPSSVVGRAAECHVVMSDPGLSRRHASITRKSDGFYIEDLGSTNGTYVDGVRVTSALRLLDGARIEVGRETLLRFGTQDELEHEAARRTHALTVRDPLTQLFNRRYMEQRLESEIAYAARHNAPLTVMVVDLDQFKEINDQHGHATGDTVLRVLAATLERMVRREDVVARIGGDEIVIISRGIDGEGARVFGERIRRGVRVLKIPAAHDGGAIRVSVSIGIAHVGGEHMCTAMQLLEAADEALYSAKRQGRDRVEVSLSVLTTPSALADQARRNNQPS